MAFKFVEHAESKNAVAFKEAVETAIAEKVSSVLEECKIEVASRMFNEDGGVPGVLPNVEKMPPPPKGAVMPGKDGDDTSEKTTADKDDDDNEEEDGVNESKWLQGAVHPSRKGMFKGVGVDQIRSRLAKLKKSGPHKKGSPKQVKQAELNFALRAKEGHGFKN